MKSSSTQDTTLTAPGTTALAFSETRFGIPATFGSVVWTSPAGESPFIVWVSDNFPVGLPGYAPWLELASPVFTPFDEPIPDTPVLGEPPLPSPPPTIPPSPPLPSATSGAPITQCPGFLPSRLVPAQQARVTPGDANNLRNAPNLTATLVGRIPGSATFNVISGPYCNNAEGIAWWQVNYNGLQGYTAEGRGGVYWLEPLPTASASPAIPPPAATPVKATLPPPPPGATAAGLAIGSRVVVTPVADNLRMRSGPGTTFPVSRILDAGTQLDILDGPRSADGFTWWRVRLVSNPGIGGWVVQGSGSEVWLQPLS